MAILSLSAAVLTAGDPDAISIERYQLDSGMHIIIAHVPDAPRQSTFTILSLHLGNDGPDRAQWSHLLEHHLLRSTDPHGLHVDGIDINGETTHHAARLDTIALPEQWPAAMQRHAAWLTARTFAVDVHAREVEMIHGEEQSTAMSGWTHKWAIAAWNQIVRHGKDHAHVHGDVANSQLAEVTQYASDHLPVNESIWIATVGPIDLQTVKDEIARQFGAVERVDRTVPGRLQNDEVPQEITGMWDLPTRHVLLWWRLPSSRPHIIAAALAVGDAVQMWLNQDQSMTKHVRVAVVHATVPTPEGTYFIINASLQRNADAMETAGAIDRAVHTLSKLPGPAFVARSIPARLLDPQTLLAQRPHAPAHMAFAVEANWMLQGLLVEYAAGCSQEELIAALKVVTQEDTAAFIASLEDTPGGVVMLEPEEADRLQQ